MASAVGDRVSAVPSANTVAERKVRVRVGESTFTKSRPVLCLPAIGSRCLGRVVVHGPPSYMTGEFREQQSHQAHEYEENYSFRVVQLVHFLLSYV